MHSVRALTQRERVFVMSLMYHGFRHFHCCAVFKKRVGYIKTSTLHEDASGIDFWVKMPGDTEFYPVQITQRGVKMFRVYRKPSPRELQKFIIDSNKRLKKKRSRCRRDNVVFVLVRDYTSHATNPTVAWGDIKALRYAVNTKL